MTVKKTTKKSPAKKTTKKTTKNAAAKKAATTTTKAPAKVAKKAPAKKAAKKAVAKSTTKAAAKSTAKSGSKRAAATKKAAPAATKKASNSSAKKATAKKNVAQSKTASAAGSTKKDQKDKTPVIPPEYGYLHDKKWLESQREALLSERASYTSSADRLAAEAAALMADREPGDVQFDEESGEGDTIAVERDRDLALSAAARQSVADIDAALERLDNNTYGMCTAGDDIIPQERLEAIPEASVCVTHKTSMF